MRVYVSVYVCKNYIFVKFALKVDEDFDSREDVDKENEPVLNAVR